MWSPRDLFEIDQIGYQKNFLFATHFPQHSANEANPKIAIEYNFFALNKDSDNISMAQDFLLYWVSSQWQQSYIDTFPYYLSPSITINAGMSEKKILSDYNIVYKNFMPEWAQLSAFNYGDITVFDSQIRNILQIEFRPEESLNSLSSYITCMTTKHSTWLNLSSPCN